MAVDNIISRTGTTGDPLVPEPFAASVIQELPTASALLQRARHVPMSAKTYRQPVLDVLPQAYWVSGDTGLKQTTKQEWKNVNLVAEELAVIVPIPEAYLDDSAIPVWDEVRPRLVEAIGAKIDAAGLFGVDKPTTWGTAVVPGAVSAGNTVADGTGTDTAQDVAKLGELLAQDGYAANGFIARPGFKWKLVGMRSQEGAPIYQPDLQGRPGGSLYGYPLSEVNNGSFDATEAELVTGDWSKVLLGLRQDITFKVFTEGVISDSSGNVVLNLMQQDAVALRVVMRVAFATANPVTAVNAAAATRFPFAVLTPDATS